MKTHRCRVTAIAIAIAIASALIATSISLTRIAPTAPTEPNVQIRQGIQLVYLGNERVMLLDKNERVMRIGELYGNGTVTWETYDILDNGTCHKRRKAP